MLCDMLVSMNRIMLGTSISFVLSDDRSICRYSPVRISRTGQRVHVRTPPSDIHDKLVFRGSIR